MQTEKTDVSKRITWSDARELAGEVALHRLTEPMLLSWLDRSTGQHSPPVDCCKENGKEAWEIYAESRGGKLRVEVGDQYVFIFGEGIGA